MKDITLVIENDEKIEGLIKYCRDSIFTIVETTRKNCYNNNNIDKIYSESYRDKKMCIESNETISDKETIAEAIMILYKTAEEV